jgi:demethoxyubiquinone hydroxylase (CLK1/Coq7/Cat5 family)
MDATEALRTQLGDPLPNCLNELDDNERDDLASAVSEARVQQARDMDVAIEDALRRLPPVLRGAVRVILRG